MANPFLWVPIFVAVVAFGYMAYDIVSEPLALKIAIKRRVGREIIGIEVRGCMAHVHEERWRGRIIKTCVKRLYPSRSTNFVIVQCADGSIREVVDDGAQELQEHPDGYLVAYI